MNSNSKRGDLYQHTRSRATKFTNTQQRQQYTRHTRDVKAWRSLLGNGKENRFLYYFKLNWLNPVLLRAIS